MIQSPQKRLIFSKTLFILQILFRFTKNVGLRIHVFLLYPDPLSINVSLFVWNYFKEILYKKKTSLTRHHIIITNYNELWGLPNKYVMRRLKMTVNMTYYVVTCTLKWKRKKVIWKWKSGWYEFDTNSKFDIFLLFTDSR